jgi:superfamily I DNA/RNA helicase
MPTEKTRPHIQRSTEELAKLATGASPPILEEIRHELAHRKGRAARRLVEDLSNGSTGSLQSSPTSKQPSPTPKFREGRQPSRRANQHQAKQRITHPPTDEQLVAIEKFCTGQSLRITAFAGAGKTSTLQFLANENSRRGLYLAFNRSIAMEAKERFPSHVDCRTTHAIAARYVRGLGRFSSNKLFGSIHARELAHILSLSEHQVDSFTILTPIQQAHLILQAIRRFCNSADSEIVSTHVDLQGALRAAVAPVRALMAEWIASQSAAVWKRMIDAEDLIPLGHDGYLKLWSLSEPIMDYGYIFVDEAQDTNPAVLKVFKKQGSQMIYVGDRHQQIYEWRGAVNAMNDISTELSTSLTQSFRFGPQIADVANQILKLLDEKEVLRGVDRIQSRITSGDEARAILARTNATVIAECLKALERERKPHIVGGTTDLKELLRDVDALMKETPGQRPEFFGFTNWQQVIDFAATDEGEPLRRFVTLVQSNGTGRLWAAVLNVTTEENEADVVISTAHKAKGREWLSVRIADDFAACQSEEHSIPEAELRLFYVAITRAKEELSIDPDLLRAFTSGRMTALEAFRNARNPKAGSPSKHAAIAHAL